jgi:hypothetical protein
MLSRAAPPSSRNVQCLFKFRNVLRICRHKFTLQRDGVTAPLAADEVRAGQDTTMGNAADNEILVAGLFRTLATSTERRDRRAASSPVRQLRFSSIE